MPLALMSRKEGRGKGRESRHWILFRGLCVRLCVSPSCRHEIRLNCNCCRQKQKLCLA